MIVYWGLLNMDNIRMSTNSKVPEANKVLGRQVIYESMSIGHYCRHSRNIT